MQVLVLVEVHSALQADPEPQPDQPPEITQSGLLVAVARSVLEQTAVSLLSPWQEVPPLEGGGLLQSRVLDFLQLLFPSLGRRGSMWSLGPTTQHLLVVAAARPAPPAAPGSVHGDSLGHGLPLRPEALLVDVALELDVGHVGLAADLARLVYFNIELRQILLF